MDRLAVWVTIAILIFAGIFAVAWWQCCHVAHRTDYIKTFPIANASLVNVLVIDNGGSASPDQRGVLHGDYAVILLADDANYLHYSFDFVNGMRNTLAFNRNYADVIDPNFPIYQRLAVSVFTPDKQLGLPASLTQAGVRALFLKPAALERAAASNMQAVGQVIGQAIMADGSQHLIRLVNVERNIFS